jgi:hypothetical protein
MVYILEICLFVRIMDGSMCIFVYLVRDLVLKHQVFSLMRIIQVKGTIYNALVNASSDGVFGCGLLDGPLRNFTRVDSIVLIDSQERRGIRQIPDETLGYGRLEAGMRSSVDKAACLTSSDLTQAQRSVGALYWPSRPACNLRGAERKG